MQEEEKYLVSIITPVYNASRTVAATIDSVLKQTYSNWELILIDDCSKDNSVSIIESYNDPRIRFYRNTENNGVAFTRNRGLDYAKGELICFLDADDYWTGHKLMKQVEVAKGMSPPFLVVSSYTKVNFECRFIKEIKLPHEINYHSLLRTNSIPCLTTLFSSDLAKENRFIKHGHEDYIFWLRILEKGCKVYTIDESLAFYRITQDSLSSNKIKAAVFQWKIYRNILRINIVKSAYYFIQYAYHAINKH